LGLTGGAVPIQVEMFNETLLQQDET